MKTMVGGRQGGVVDGGGAVAGGAAGERHFRQGAGGVAVGEELVRLRLVPERLFGGGVGGDVAAQVGEDHRDFWEIGVFWGWFHVAFPFVATYITLVVRILQIKMPDFT